MQDVAFTRRRTTTCRSLLRVGPARYATGADRDRRTRGALALKPPSRSVGRAIGVELQNVSDLALEPTVSRSELAVHVSTGRTCWGEVIPDWPRSHEWEWLRILYTGSLTG